MASDPLLDDLNRAWEEDDQLRPDAPPGPPHGVGLVDLTGSSPLVQDALWRLGRAMGLISPERAVYTPSRRT